MKKYYIFTFLLFFTTNQMISAFTLPAWFSNNQRAIGEGLMHGGVVILLVNFFLIKKDRRHHKQKLIQIEAALADIMAEKIQKTRQQNLNYNAENLIKQEIIKQWVNILKKDYEKLSQNKITFRECARTSRLLRNAIMSYIAAGKPPVEKSWIDNCKKIHNLIQELVELAPRSLENNLGRRYFVLNKYLPLIGLGAVVSGFLIALLKRK